MQGLWSMGCHVVAAWEKEDVFCEGVCGRNAVLALWEPSDGLGEFRGAMSDVHLVFRVGHAVGYVFFECACGARSCQIRDTVQLPVAQG